MSALQGLRVLDISSGIAGPFCARLLADAGADVIKIEDPRGGDATRRENPIFADHRLEDISALFIYLNQNKRGVSLNIESVTGREILKQMAEKSDVVVESFAPGTLERLGVSHGELRRIRPGIVLISITDFGQTGPYRDYKATHLTLSALGGWQQGEATREPIQAGFPVLYYMAGLWGAIGALAALRGSHQDEGQHVDISVMDVCLNANTPTKVRELFGAPPAKRRIAFPGNVKAKDGWAAVNSLTAQHWQDALALMDMADVLADEELSYNALKRERIRPELEARANEWAKDKTRYEILYAAQELRIPAGLPYTSAEMLESPQYLEREFFVKTAQPGVGEFLQPRAGFVAPSLCQQRRPAPELGEHNWDVYRELGLQADDLLALRNAGII